MKQTLYYLFLTLTGLLAAPFTARAQTCTTAAGNLVSTAPIAICQGAGFTVQSAGDAVLDGDDVLLFVAATSPGLPLGTVIATSPDGQFAPNPAFQLGTTYYVFTAAGNDDGSGGISWTDTCLSVSAAATLTVQPAPVANASVFGLLTCNTTSLQLSGVGSSTGPNFVYQWTGPNIVTPSNILNPTINEPGTYCLVVTNTATGCSATDCVDVAQDAQTPTAETGQPQILTCAVFQVQLDASGSSTGPNLTYNWSSNSGGNITSGQTTLVPTVNAPGMYCLTVTNTDNGCTATDCVLVLQDITPPSADAGTDYVLTCLNNSITLDGSSSSGQNFTYVWTGPDINVNNVFLLNPTVSVAGIYCIVVTNTQNGCTTTDCVVVTQDVTSPTITTTDGTFSCTNPVATLSASATPPTTVFQWSGPLGFSATGPTAQVNIEATYTVLATDPINGCTATATAMAQGDSTLPRVDAVVVNHVCGTSGGSISLTPNPPGQLLEYFWSTGVLGPVISDLPAGDYLVTISDPQSGCSKAVHFHIDSETILFTQNVTPPSCSGVSNGALSVTPLNGTGPYTFQWIGPNGFSSTQPILTGIAGGSYKVTITDALGCSVASGWIGVNQPNPITVPNFLVQIQPSCGNSGSISLTVNGGTPPYLYNWSDGTTTEDKVGLPPGTYTLTITDANGCTFSPPGFDVPAAPQVLIANQVIITCTDATVVLTPTPGNANYAYAWSNGATTPVLNTGGIPGIYTVTVIDLNTGCTLVLSFDLTGTAGDDCAVVKGRVGQDDDTDCVTDAAEPGLAGWIVRALGQDTFYTVTGPDGTYQVGVLPGNYLMQAMLPNTVWQDCGPAPVNVAALGDTVTVDLPIQAVVLCPALTVDVSTAQLRRCFDNNYYFIHYCNMGTAAATDAYVLLALDPFVYAMSSNQAYTHVGNNTVRFNLGTVEPGECGDFWLRVLVDCSAQLGQTHCTEAHIFPDTLCLPNDPNWTGASIEVQALCDGDSVHFNIKNAGNGPMSTELDYIVIEDGIMLMQTSGPALAAGDSVLVSVPANGSTWRVEATQEAFHPGPSMPAAVVEGCTTTGSFSTGFVNQFPPNIAGPALDIDCTVNTGSFDPNDKQGFPSGYGAVHYVRPGTELEYLIRFQNTGTDTAFTVVVRDTLSSWLDPTTVQPGTSSHPYTFDLTGEGVVVFRFDNILLADSFVNEPASHGFVRFRIAPRADVPLETDILNRAAIYFDFNEPVLTNTTQHRVGLNFIATGIFTPEQPPTDVHIMPNPWASETTVRLEEWPAGERLTLSIFNSTGRLVRQDLGQAPAYLLQANGLPPGLYWLKVESAGKLGLAKFVLR